MNLGNYMFDFLKKERVMAAPVPEEKYYNARGVVFPESHANELRRIIFSEVSNREPAKQELEARVLFNTALNRVLEHGKRGKNTNLAQILTEPNQYQGYNTSLYQQYDKPTDVLTKKRKQQIDVITDKLLAEATAGNFQDNTNGAFYYQHKGDKIYYDDKKPLFKTAQNRAQPLFISQTNGR